MNYNSKNAISKVQFTYCVDIDVFFFWIRVLGQSYTGSSVSWVLWWGGEGSLLQSHHRPRMRSHCIIVYQLFFVFLFYYYYYYVCRVFGYYGATLSETRHTQRLRHTRANNDISERTPSCNIKRHIGIMHHRLRVHRRCGACFKNIKQ